MANMWNTVVIRRDLNLSPGYEDAQVAHIQDGWQRDTLIKLRDKLEAGVEITLDDLPADKIGWCREPYLNILVVDNREELEHIIFEAGKAGLPTHVWRDLIPSESLKINFPNMLVGVGIGPCGMDEVKAVCGNLKRA